MDCQVFLLIHIFSHCSQISYFNDPKCQSSCRVFFFGITNNKFLSATSPDGFSLSWCCKMPQTPHNMASCAQPMKQQLSPPFSPVKNNEAKKHKRKSTSVDQFYDEEAVSQPSAPSETVACRYLRPAGDSLSKSCCWLFPMSESSAPAAPPASHSWFVLDFMVHGGPLPFPRGDYGAGQMASRMHLGTAVAPASTPGLHLQPSRSKNTARLTATPAGSLAGVNRAQLEGIRWRPSKLPSLIADVFVRFQTEFTDVVVHILATV